MLLAVILFGIYRREYLSQAIPVYMQYLEQRDKWEHKNTGNYVYLHVGSVIKAQYFVIKDNKLYRYFYYGNPRELKWLAKPTKFSQPSLFMKRKLYLIDRKFDIIKDIFIKKLFDRFPWKSNQIDRYSYAILYDKENGYPKELFVNRENNKDKIVLGFIDSYTEFLANDLIMLPKNFKFTQKEMTKIMKKYKHHKKDVFYKDSNIVEKKGGDLIKSAIYR